MLDQCLLFRDIFDNRHDHDLDFSPRKISRAFFQGVCGLMMMRLLSKLFGWRFPHLNFALTTKWFLEEEEAGKWQHLFLLLIVTHFCSLFALLC